MSRHGKTILWITLALVAAVGCNRVDRQVAKRLEAAGNALAKLDFAAEEHSTVHLGERTFRQGCTQNQQH